MAVKVSNLTGAARRVCVDESLNLACVTQPAEVSDDLWMGSPMRRTWFGTRFFVDPFGGGWQPVTPPPEGV